MTAPLRATPHLAAVPASQHTAPVAEFRCLFTHDVRRKQKRWQDGYLKFHTFNNRVMVYDQARNSIGDTYWKESNEVQEGDELSLDKGVLVEVAEAIGLSQTDLTPLFEKRSPQTKPPQARNAVLPRPPPRPSVVPSNASRPNAQLRHKSLNALLGTPKGPTGKAVPIRSPYEIRREQENEWPDERIAKKQKTIHPQSHVQSSSPIARAPPSMRRDPPTEPAAQSTTSLPKVPQQLSSEAAVIHLDSEPEPEHILSDVTLPSTPPGMQKPKRSVLPVPATVIKPALAKEPAPVAVTPRIPRGKVPVPSVKALETPKPLPVPSSPPVSASNRISNVGHAVRPANKPSKMPSPASSSPILAPPPPEKKGKPLRLPTTQKRGMLMCQMLPQQRARPSAEPSTAAALKSKRRVKPQSVEVDPKASKFEPVPWPLDDEDDDNAQELVHPSIEDRAPEIRKEVITRKRKPQSGPTEKPASKKSKTLDVLPPSSPAFEPMEIVHGVMDQKLIPDEPLEQETLTRSRPSAPAKVFGTKSKAVTKVRKEKDSSIQLSSPPKAPARKVSKTAAKKAQKAQARSVSPDITPLQPPKIDLPLAIQATRDVSRNPSTSPRKPALSTGGFRKKPKQAQSTTSNPPTTNSTSSKPTAPSLLPHPLRANKSGPLMTTAELSAQLQKAQTHIRLEDDPIEDASQAKAESQKKTLRRVRSENDSPIPSTSAAWEERNLSKHDDDDVVVRNDSPTTTTPALTVSKPGPAVKLGSLAALVKQTDPRRKFKRGQSLNIDTGVGVGPGAKEGREESVEVPSPVVDTDVGPWSTEAFDLFAWRPPGRVGEGKGEGG
jgi:hypothetical protein